MCLNPIKIPNPSRRFVKGVSQSFIMVPCRHCSECESHDQDNWFVRAQMEYVRCCKAGGEVWFPTLTFNDEHLPMYRDFEHHFECQCINPVLLKRFRDHFRVNLGRMLAANGLPYDIRNIRFEFVSEFGGDLGRIHHHALIFVPFKVPEWIMVDCIERAWAYREEPMKYLVQKRRGSDKGNSYYRYCKDPETGKTIYVRVPKNGFVMWSNKGKKILSASGIRYVQKYISKPQEWIKKYGVDDYEKHLKDIIRQFSSARRYPDKVRNDVRELARRHCRAVGEFWRLDSSFKNVYPHMQPISPDADDDILFERALYDAIDRLRQWRRVKPRHFQSTFFGIDGIDYFVDTETGEFDIDKLVDGRINLGDRSRYGDYAFIDQKHPDFLYNMPTYYVNKIFKDKDEFGLYVNGDLYDRVFEKRFEKSQNLLCNQYDFYFQTPDVLRSHLAGLCLPASEVNELYKILHDVMAGRSVHDLVLYETVYQGRAMEEGIDFISSHIVSPAGFVNPAYDGLTGLELFRRVAVNYLHYQKHLEYLREPDPERFRNRSNYSISDATSTFGNHPCFMDFDYVLDTIHDYELRLGMLQDSANRLKQERIAKVMKMCKSRSMSNISHQLYVQSKLSTNYGN